MNKILIIFDEELAIPSDDMSPIKVYGFILENTEIVIINNIQKYVNYVKVIEQLMKEEVDFVGKGYFIKNGKQFTTDDKTWKKYAKKVENRLICFSVINADKLKIKEEDINETFFVNKKVWKQQKEKNDIIWYL